MCREGGSPAAWQAGWDRLAGGIPLSAAEALQGPSRALSGDACALGKDSASRQRSQVEQVEARVDAWAVLVLRYLTEM